ncbi:Vitelline membrane outer layer protein 1 [Folsomia candida]|uniref:Vitelline membrane outer layer protein 1 n=1 Tax=Folsomia candida TaxID=158441 RepID=A0A226EEC3_FOLCA|nr:Vitelline membrane outer layer protein 1 [Folsomia candida]
MKTIRQKQIVKPNMYRIIFSLENSCSVVIFCCFHRTLIWWDDLDKPPPVDELDDRLNCAGGLVLEGDGITEWGDWTTPQQCPRGTVLCGIQTQVETADVTDETGLNNVKMVCYDRPT